MDTLSSVLASIEGVRSNAELSNTVTNSLRICIFAAQETWSRASRRKRKREEYGRVTSLQKPETADHVLQVVIQDVLVPQKDNVRTSPSWGLECLWVQGKERALFDSFWSHVSRKVRATLLTT